MLIRKCSASALFEALKEWVRQLAAAARVPFEVKYFLGAGPACVVGASSLSINSTQLLLYNSHLAVELALAGTAVPVDTRL